MGKVTTVGKISQNNGNQGNSQDHSIAKTTMDNTIAFDNIDAF
jgi:hypothetical protein